MGSLNGDIMVKRNGRCTSQVSVYNYPEHLNPFYEDDQHKRLRFWTLNKCKDRERRNSISFGNLRDIWGFKSFRLKKKSSTLGINKTSESPPLLRRQLQQPNGYNALDTSKRQYNNSTSNAHEDNFQRNTISNSSFQHLLIRKQDPMGFNRNDGYRSTIQVPDANHMRHLQENLNSSSKNFNRYVYRGSMTPQPLRNLDLSDNNNSNNTNNYNIGYNKRFSRNNAVSTNPFDDTDEKDNNNDDSTKHWRNVTEKTAIKMHTPYKKRRAPPPPPSVITATEILSELEKNHSTNNDKNNNELCIAENTDIANLTAEIEHFVQAKNNSNVEKGELQKITVKKPDTTTTIKNGSPRNVNHDKQLLQTFTNPIEKSACTNLKNTILTHEDENNVNDFKDTCPSVKDTIPTIEPIMECIQNSDSKTNELSNNSETKSSPLPESSEMSVKIISQTTPNSCPIDSDCVALEKKEKPTPTKRKPKNNTESKSPNVQYLRSFKPESNDKTQLDKQITAKTSFVLTGPPAEIKDSKKENIIKSNESNGKCNKEAQSNDTDRSSFADIHRPTKSKPISKLFKNNQEKFNTPMVPETIKKPLRAKPNVHDEIFIGNESSTLRIDESPVNDRDVMNTDVKNGTLELESNQLEYRHRALSQEWKQSTLATLEPNIPPEKRKSVRDIIESINRSQRILNAAANKDFPAWPTHVEQDNYCGDKFSCHSFIMNNKDCENTSTNILKENIRKSDEPEVKSTHIINKTESFIANEQTPISGKSGNADKLSSNTVINLESSSSSLPSHTKMHIDQQKIDNYEIIQKGSLTKEKDYEYRESSPIASNLDWNPLPKPKRIKPIHEEE